MKRQLNNNLNNCIQNNGSINEICLFRQMALILNSISQTNAVFVKETHSNAGLVSFTSKNGQTRTKEIADILTVVYNRRKEEIRISFLQAKYKRKFNITPFLKKSADYYQWDLLKNRYPITSNGSICFPSNILSFTRYKSITSYGIFYWNKKQIDMLYAIPDFLSSSNNNPVGKRPTTTLRLNCPVNGPIAGGYTASCPMVSPCNACFYINNGCRCCYGKEEILTSCDIDIYEQFLLDGYIGAPLKIEDNDDITLFIYSLLVNAKLGTEDGPIGEICKFLEKEGLTKDSSVKGNRIPLNILAIATDGYEKKPD